MKKVYTGKTKDVFEKPDGNLVFQFKDDVTGEDGVVDPGANTVMGQIKGKGKMSLEVSHHFLSLLGKAGIPTHLISADLPAGTMEVRAAQNPGTHLYPEGGLEFICRCKAYGSFLKRYRNYIAEELQNLNYLVEITLKDDQRGDPLITEDALLTLGLLQPEQLAQSKALTRKATKVIEEHLQEKGLVLVDLKFEFGLIEGEMVLIDEVSADSMRVMEDDKVLSHEEVFRRLKKY